MLYSSTSPLPRNRPRSDSSKMLDCLTVSTFENGFLCARAVLSECYCRLSFADCTHMLHFATYAQLPEGITTDGAAFLRACFTVDPKLRPPARTLLHHDWLSHLSRSLPPSAFESDPVGPPGPGPPATPKPAAEDSGAEAQQASVDVTPGGRTATTHLRGSISTPCLQAEEGGWSSD